ncbi:MAG: Fic family protein [Clostridium sp.]|nr:Fic family protein [Clostridium sp.]
MENKYNMSVKDNILYAKRNIVDSIYTEARLEGIGVTYPDTQEIYEGRAVAGLSIEDTMKMNNLKHAWQFIMDNIDYPSDLRFIRQINTEIGRGIILNEGQLRTSDVKIGGTPWRPGIPDEDVINKHIHAVMGNQNTSATEKAIDIMLYIMRSQMFMDGNKRTAQLMANKIMIENGAGIICIPVDKQKEFLSELIDFYESNDSQTIKTFVYQNCIDGIEAKTMMEKKQKFRWINGDIPIDFPIPEVLKNTMQEAEELDLAGNIEYTHVADIIDVLCKNFTKDGTLTDEQWDAMVDRYPVI